MAIMGAMNHENNELVKLLIKFGGDVNKALIHTHEPEKNLLLLALRHLKHRPILTPDKIMANKEVVKLIIQGGADVFNVKDSKGNHGICT